MTFNYRHDVQNNDAAFLEPAAVLRLPLAVLALICCTQAWSADPTTPAPAWLEVNPPPAAEPLYEEETEEVGKMTVTGKSRRFAIINGQKIKPGDEFNGSRVQAIHAGKIVTENAEKSQSLAPKIKHPATRQRSGDKAAPSRKQQSRQRGTQ